MEAPLAVLEHRARRRRLLRRRRARRKLAAPVVVASILLPSSWLFGLAAGQHPISAATAREGPRQHDALARIRQPPVCPAPTAVRPLIARASASTGLSPALLVAVVRTESQFDPDAVSQAGAEGLFQLMPQTAAAYRIDPSKPAANALAGARYLREMLRRFRHLDLALSATTQGRRRSSEQAARRVSASFGTR